MDFHDVIAQLACEFYVESGRVEGHDLENWLEAEWIVRRLYKSWDDLADYPGKLG